MKMFILFFAIFSSIQVFAEQNLYLKGQSLFASGSIPQLELLQSGWYSGRCYTRRSPELEKSALLVLMQMKAHGQTMIKQILPPETITFEADKFDQVSDVEYQQVSQELYEKENMFAYAIQGSLTSDLYYDQLIGTIHTRQVGQDLVVAFTNYNDIPDENQNAYFYCLINKKVHDL